jgi:hypothetical protein
MSAPPVDPLTRALDVTTTVFLANMLIHNGQFITYEGLTKNEPQAPSVNAERMRRNCYDRATSLLDSVRSLVRASEAAVPMTGPPVKLSKQAERSLEGMLQKGKERVVEMTE